MSKSQRAQPAGERRAPTGVDRILAAAARHGQDDEPDHEVGDLQDALRLCWSRLSAAQRREVLVEYLQEHPDEEGRWRE